MRKGSKSLRHSFSDHIQPKSNSSHLHSTHRAKFGYRWLGLAFLVLCLLIQNLGLNVTIPVAAASPSNTVAEREPTLANNLHQHATITPHHYQPNPRAVPFWQELPQRQQQVRTVAPASHYVMRPTLPTNLKFNFPKTVKPSLTFVNTYYAYQLTDDAGTASPTVCTTNPAPSTTNSCSLRSAINLAQADTHNTSPDLILIQSYLTTSGNAYKLNSSLPVLPDYVYLSDFANPTDPASCPVAQSNRLTPTAVIDLISAVAGTVGLTVGSHDYISGIEVTNQSGTIPHTDGDGIVINGSSNTLNCVFSDNHHGNGLTVLPGANNNIIGGVFGDNNGDGTGNNPAYVEFATFGNDGNGVLINNASGNVIRDSSSGHYPGFPNGNDQNNKAGILLQGGANNNTIGSNGVTETNYIGPNVDSGVYLTDVGTSANQLINSIIGIDPTGTFVINASHTITYSNFVAGVVITKGASGNTIGGSSAGQGNTISGNEGPGITIDGANFNNIFGNSIGTNITGTAALANFINGIYLTNGASSNTIGGSSAGQGNTISGNEYSGVTLYGPGTNNNTISGNLIGVTKDRNSALPNGSSSGSTGTVCDPSGGSESEDCNGIFLSTNGSAAGPTGTQIDGNIIAAVVPPFPDNLDAAGILLDYSNANTIQGNSIGAAISGSNVISYSVINGIYLLNGSSNNQLGGDSSQGQGNLIGDYGYYGIIVGNFSFSGGPALASTISNKIQGNAIGEDFTGAGNTKLNPFDLGFSFNDGIYLESITTTAKSISNNLIGVDYSPATPNSNQANLIGNTLAQTNPNLFETGIELTGPNNDSNQINGNKIGVSADTNSSTTGIKDNSIVLDEFQGGVEAAGPTNTQIQGNVIGAANVSLSSGTNSDEDAIFLTGAITHTTITKNYIGTNANGANLHNVYGIYLQQSLLGGPNQTVISQNVIANSLIDGVLVGNDATQSTVKQNTISQNSIYNNANLGINLNYTAARPTGVFSGASSGPNNQAQAPIISTTMVVNGSLQVTGKANPNSIVEVFQADNSTKAQGKTYLATTTADASGNFSVKVSFSSFTTTNNLQLVATSTLTTPAIYAGSTSQFSAPYSVPALPTLTVAPTSLTFTATVGGPNPPSQGVTLTSQNNDSNWSSSITFGAGASGWLTTTPTSGSVISGTSQLISVTATTGSLAAGTYTATIVFNNSSNPMSQPSVNVTFIVSPATVTGYIYYLPFLANNYTPNGTTSSFTSYLAFQNVGTAPANVTIQFFDASGAPLVAPPLSNSSNCSPVPQNGECLPPIPLPSGTKGTGIITSTQPLAVIVPEGTPYGGSAYAVPAGSSNSLVAPFAINGAYGGYYTQLNVFNGGSTPATVTVTFFNQDGTPAPSSSTQVVSLAPHTAINLDQSATGSGLPAPNPTTGYQGFNGWAQITGTTSNLAAQVLEQNPGQHFVAIANAVALPQNTLYAPAIFNNGYGGFYTGANIVNPGATTVTVTVTYYDKDTGTPQAAAPFTMTAHSVVGIFQGNTSGIGLPTNGLPNGFIGAMSISAVGGGVVSSVNENGGLTQAGNSRSGVYAAVANGGSRVGLPVISNGGYTYVTGDTVFNNSSSTVTATIQYYNTDGTLVPNVGQTFSVGPHSSAASFQGLANLPTGFYGTAVVTEIGGPANALIITTNAQNSALFYTYTEPNS